MSNMAQAVRLALHYAEKNYGLADIFATHRIRETLAHRGIAIHDIEVDQAGAAANHRLDHSRERPSEAFFGRCKRRLVACFRCGGRRFRLWRSAGSFSPAEHRLTAVFGHDWGVSAHAQLIAEQAVVLLPIALGLFRAIKHHGVANANAVVVAQQVAAKTLDDYNRQAAATPTSRVTAGSNPNVTVLPSLAGQPATSDL